MKIAELEVIAGQYIFHHLLKADDGYSWFGAFGVEHVSEDSVGFATSSDAISHDHEIVVRLKDIEFGCDQLGVDLLIIGVFEHMVEIELFGPAGELVFGGMGLDDYLLVGGEMMDGGGGVLVIPESKGDSEVVDGCVGHQYIS